MITNNYNSNSSYSLNGLSRIFLIIDNITTEIQGLKSASYDCQVNDDGAYTFTHTLTIGLHTTAYNLIKELINQDISFAFVTKNGDKFILKEKCLLTYNFSVGNQSEFTITLQTPSKQPIIAVDNIVVDEVIQLESCGYLSSKIDSVLLGETGKCSVSIGDDDFVVNGKLHSVLTLKNSTQYTETLNEDGIYEQTLTFNVPFSTYYYALGYGLLQFPENSFYALLHTTDLNFILAGFGDGLQPSYSINSSSENNIISITLSLSSTSFNGVHSKNYTLNEQDKFTYLPVDNYCINGLNVNTLINKVGTNEYLCFSGFEELYKDYNIVGTYSNPYSTEFGIKLYNEGVQCNDLDECVIYGLPSKIDFTPNSTSKQYTVQTDCSLSFSSGNNAVVTYSNNTLTISNQTASGAYQIVCTDSNSYKHTIFCTVHQYEERQREIQHIDAFDNTVNLVLSESITDVYDIITNGLNYETNRDGNGYFVHIPANAFPEEKEYVITVQYQEKPITEVFTIIQQGSYSIYVIDGSEQCIGTDKWAMANRLIGVSEDEISGDDGYVQAYMIEKNCVDCLHIKGSQTIEDNINLFGKIHNVVEFGTFDNKYINKVISTNVVAEDDAYVPEMTWHVDKEMVRCIEGQTVYMEVLYITVYGVKYRTEYAKPSTVIAEDSNLCSFVVPESDTLKYKWAETDDEICTDAISVNCTSATTVPYQAGDPSTYICKDGYIYSIENQYISKECDNKYEFAGSFPLTKKSGRKSTACGWYEVGDFDIVMLNDDETYIQTAFYDGIITESAYKNDTDFVRLDIGSMIYKVDFQAFYGCNRLSTLNLTNVQHIDEQSFANCKLQEVILPEICSYIGLGAFANNELTMIQIPESVKIIESEAFSNNPITEIYFFGTNPPQLRDDTVFSKNTIQKVHIPINAVNSFENFIDYYLGDAEVIRDL